jgi:hypothetical protein
LGLYLHQNDCPIRAPIMKRSLIAAVILTFYGLIALGQTASAPASINALRNAQKQVRWDDKSAVVADVTCDGLPDTLVVGYQPDKVWLGVVHGAKRNVTPTTETLSFSLGKSETSFCTSPVHIETAPIDWTTPCRAANLSRVVANFQWLIALAILFTSIGTALINTWYGGVDNLWQLSWRSQGGIFRSAPASRRKAQNQENATFFRRTEVTPPQTANPRLSP